MDSPIYNGRVLAMKASTEVRPEVRDAHAAIEKVNNVFYDEDGHDLAMLLATDHRTLQQSFMRNVVIPFILWEAQNWESGRHDQRNEGTAKLCAVLADKISDVAVPLPLV